MANLVLFTKTAQQHQQDRMELFMLSHVDANADVTVVSDEPAFWRGRLSQEAANKVQFVPSEIALIRLSLFDHGTQILVDPKLHSRAKAALAAVALRTRVPITYAS